MIEISYKTPDILVIKNSDKKEVLFHTQERKAFLEEFDVTHPGEYEKSGNLLEVRKYTDILFYKFLIDGKHLCIVTSDAFDLKEDIISFFGDVDILIIIGSKDAVKVYENIEAKVVIPYGEGKDLFLSTTGQHPEALKSYKLGAELDGDKTEFINLEG